MWDNIFKGAPTQVIFLSKQPKKFEFVINLKAGQADWRDDSANVLAVR